MKQAKISMALLFGLLIGIAVYQKSLEAEGTGKANKICSAFVADNWRNDLPVPPHWTSGDCWNWAVSIGANEFRMGCLTHDSLVYGPGMGDFPSPNCGW